MGNENIGEQLPETKAEKEKMRYVTFIYTNPELTEGIGGSAQALGSEVEEDFEKAIDRVKSFYVDAGTGKEKNTRDIVVAGVAEFQEGDDLKALINENSDKVHFLIDNREKK